MYICDSCRGVAVTNSEPGLVGVWLRAPLNYDLFLIIHGRVGDVL